MQFNSQLLVVERVYNFNGMQMQYSKISDIFQQGLAWSVKVGCCYRHPQGLVPPSDMSILMGGHLFAKQPFIADMAKCKSWRLWRNIVIPQCWLLIAGWVSH